MNLEEVKKFEEGTNSTIIKGNKSWFYNSFNFETESDKWKGYWVNDFKHLDSLKPFIIVNDEKIYLKKYFKEAEADMISQKTLFDLETVQIIIESKYLNNRDILVFDIHFKTSEESETIEFGFDVLINHKKYDLNAHEEHYEVWQDGFNKHVQVKSSQAATLFGFKKEEEINFNQEVQPIEYKSKDGKIQNALLIDGLTKKVQTVNNFADTEFYLTGTKMIDYGKVIDFITIQKIKQKLDDDKDLELKNWLKEYKTELTPELKNLINNSINNVRLLSRNEQIFAGYPWFSQFWVRDFLHSIKGLLCINQINLVKSCLFNIIQKYYEKDEIPRIIKEEQESEYGSFDSNVLILKAIKDYYDYTKDDYFIEELKNFITTFSKKLLTFFKTELNDGGVSWMDTLKRNSAIENVYFFHESVNASIILHERFGNEELINELKELKKKVENYLKSQWLTTEKYFKDNIKSRELRPNQLFLLNSKIVSREQKQSVIKHLTSKKMFCKGGVRTLTKDSKKYSEKSYHNGQCWGFLNNLLLKQLFELNESNHSSELLNLYFDDLKKGVIGGLSELYDNRTGKGTGAYLQLWTNTLLFEAFDENMFGLKPVLSEKKIFLTAKFLQKPLTVKRLDKKVGGLFVDINITKNEGSDETIYEIFFSGKTFFEIELILEPGVNAIVNDEILETNVFSPNKSNKIVLKKV